MYQRSIRSMHWRLRWCLDDGCVWRHLCDMDWRLFSSWRTARCSVSKSLRWRWRGSCRRFRSLPLDRRGRSRRVR